MFEKMDTGQEQAFVQYWSEKYKWPQVRTENGDGVIDYFTELNVDDDLSVQNIKKLLRWKEKRFLSSGDNECCLNNYVERIVEQINKINIFRNGKVTPEAEVTFDELIKRLFPNGSGVWSIFVKHIARPWDFPIFDNHVWNAYCTLTGKEITKLSFDCYKEYRNYFLSLYKAVYGTDKRERNLETVKNMKVIDNALFAYDVNQQN